MNQRVSRLILAVFACVVAISAAVAADPAAPVACGGTEADQTGHQPDGQAWQVLKTGPAEKQQVAVEDFARSIGATTQRTDSDPPACPDVFGCVTTSCAANTPCRRSGGTTTDTGNTACTAPNGGVIACLGGKTIHVTAGGCSRCACCTAPIPCVCPETCGTFQFFDCQ